MGNTPRGILISERREQMPWKDQTLVTIRREFVTRASQDGVNMTALCRQYGISRKTGYKWRRAAATETGTTLGDRPRTPHHQPRRSAPEVEAPSSRCGNVTPAGAAASWKSNSGRAG